MVSTTQRTQPQILTVSHLNRLSRTVLEREIGLVWLSGEISNFVAASSGHWYFTLKDDRAQVRCAMFRGANQRVSTRPRQGDHVLVRASVGLYEPRGDYQLVVEHLEPEGEGKLKLAFDALKNKLLAMGLFASENKRALPEHIRRVGVITSSSGAALHDVLTVLARRSPTTTVIVYPSLVQGEFAAGQLCQAIDTANRRNEVDVILLTRGGGSMEDLWCFNDEQLAYTIANSQLPIVSAVGHEVDVTIADFVADVRAPTPSAAAELVSRDNRAQVEQLNTMIQRMVALIQRQVQFSLQRQRQLEQRLERTHPTRMLSVQAQRLDQLELALRKSMLQMLQGRRQQLQLSQAGLKRNEPQRQIEQRKQQHAQLSRQLSLQMQRILQLGQQRLATQAHLLQSVSPLATLARGYSITLDAQQKPITNSQQVMIGDTLETKMQHGTVFSEVCNVVVDATSNDTK